MSKIQKYKSQQLQNNVNITMCMCSGRIISLLLVLVIAFTFNQTQCDENLQYSDTSNYGAVDISTKRPVRFVQQQHTTSTGTRYTRLTAIGQKDKNYTQAKGYHHKNDKIKGSTDNAITVSLLQDDPSTGPCYVQYCTEDTIVNCVGLSLAYFRAIWLPRNTTIILLDNNDLEVIDNVSFSHLNELRVLSLSNNKIKLIQQNAFRGLKHLETLNLEYNRLTEASYPPGVFDPLVSLTDLRLRYNKENSNLPDNLFTHLKNLNSLTIDANGHIFLLGNEFSKLTELVLSGNVKVFNAESFVNVQHVTQLVIENVPSLSNFTDTAVQPLHHLDKITLSRSYIGITKSLHILKPLIGKNITEISYHQVSVNHNERYSGLIYNEGILNLKMTKYLIQICVRNFSLTSSYIFVVEGSAFMSPLWKICLHNIDLSDNHIVGNRLSFFFVMKYRNIEVLNVQGALRSCYNKESFTIEKTMTVEYGLSPVMNEESVDNASLLNIQTNKLGSRSIGSKIENVIVKKMKTKQVNKFVGVETLHQQKPLPCSHSTAIPEGKHFSGYFTFYFSNSLKNIQFSRVIAGFNLSSNFVFLGLSNVVSFDARDNMLTNFTGNIIGFDSLQILMLSGNDISDLAEYFFDGMCNIVELDLSNCRLNTDFFAHQSARITQNLSQLKRLDLSSNLLYSLQSGTFASNKMLEQLDLSTNRFKNIPFNLKDTPNLKMLDLRENSLPSLKPIERDELDKLANQPGGFDLLISGNVLSCECDSLKFLHWLTTTRVRLDIVHKFTCMNNEGQLSYWSVSNDLEELWRRCWGEIFLSFALILLFSMGIGFLSVFVIWKNKTYFMVKLLEIVTGYKQKRREDYQIGVFIGYADKDYNFPCSVLRKFIEDDLHLTTYVSHRDMDPSRDRASCIFDAINASWRTILVCTDNFLFNDEWSMFTLRSAVYAQSPVNPSRVVVLVLEDLEHRLPVEVLSALPADNILVVSQWTMSYSLKEKLKTRL